MEGRTPSVFGSPVWTIGPSSFSVQLFHTRFQLRKDAWHDWKIGFDSRVLRGGRVSRKFRVYRLKFNNDKKRDKEKKEREREFLCIKKKENFVDRVE